MAKVTPTAPASTKSPVSRMNPTHKDKNTGVFSLPSAGGVLLASVGCLLVLSLIMVTSASIPFAFSQDMDELYFFQHQLVYIGIGILAGIITYYFKLSWFYVLLLQVFGLLITVALLILTLVFGDPINGAKRWIEIGSFNFQVAELVKLVMVLFTADFVVRRANEVRHSWDGFLRIFIVVSLITTLLLLQPDFGSLVIIICTILAMFYVAGAPQGQFMILGSVVAGLSALAIWFKEYRFARVTSFLDPFNDIQGSDYQLARSLIAFGRGKVTGVGYGESVQKLAHLPEAHTDFLLAITGEELGFIGVIAVLLLEALIIASTMRISYLALKRRQMRLSYTAFGFGIIFIGQSIINAGMNMGIMPTKGLTMPFFSYGGSSMLVCLVMVGLLLKIHKQSPLIPAAQCRHY